MDVVYDSVVRGTIEGSMRCVAPRGMLVTFGAVSGAVDVIEPLALVEAGSLFFTRPHMADNVRDTGEVEHHAAGRVLTAIDRILPLDAAAEAHRILEARETRGKLRPGAWRIRPNSSLLRHSVDNRPLSRIPGYDVVASRKLILPGEHIHPISAFIGQLGEPAL